MLSHEVIVLPSCEEQLEDGETGSTENNRTDAGCAGTTVQGKESLISIDVLKRFRIAHFLTHVLALCNHLSLNCIKRMADDSVGEAEEATSEGREGALSQPIASLLVV